ncbi:DUF1566 domain-containing protein [Candidatus Bipolaricaulota bacterium]
MRTRRLLVIIGVVLVLGIGMLAGRQLAKMGSTDSLGGPTDPASESYTLGDIWQRLHDGTPGSMDVFDEPGSGPTSGTMYTLNDVMEKAPERKDASGAVASDVLSGKEFWGLTSGAWGMKTGTAAPCTDCPSPKTMVGTRWCDNKDGTVTDMTTGLIWLQKADWGGKKPWRRLVDDPSYCANGEGYMCYDDAHARAGRLKAGATDADLSDGSGAGEWRLPTKDELHGITEGTDPVSDTNMRAFTGVQPFTDLPTAGGEGFYWSSNTHDGTGGSIAMAWFVDMTYGTADYYHKNSNYYVWPVRGP